jgi:hypothetical protein
MSAPKQLICLLTVSFMLLATRNFHSPLASGGFPHWCLDNAFDLVNRIWRYSGNQINTVVFMICLKKELLRAYTFSSSISVLCVITLWQRSNAWQGQSSVQDKFCSKQTQPLLQTDLVLKINGLVKGVVDGFSYFSLISVILFYYQNHPIKESFNRGYGYGV